jgi:2,5-dichlorohydroquinone reductive dechlorinase
MNAVISTIRNSRKSVVDSRDLVRIVQELRKDLGYQPTASTAEPEPRFELFHAPNSICSQKVRAALAYLGEPYSERTIDLFAGQTYLPSNVRLRMIGCETLNMPLAQIHSGSTAVSNGGCDAAVVPTLVDWDHGLVIVDSKRICLYLDASLGRADRLCPPEFAVEVERELAIVDDLPNYQMLMGPKLAKPSTLATGKSGQGAAFSLAKVKRCERYLDQYRHDPLLERAYRAKRDKEQAAADNLFTPQALERAHDLVISALSGLNERFRDHGGRWIFGDRFTMADLFWGVELLRIENLGASGIWSDGKLHQVEQFFGDVTQLPAIRNAVFDWPDARI